MSADPQLHQGTQVTVTGVRKTFGTGRDQQIRAVDGVDLSVAPGEIVAITGASGSGKSTLLHLIGALERPTEGTITVDGTDLTTLRRKRLAQYRRTVGFVFQRYNLLPALTAQDNVLAPVLPFKVPFDKPARARELLASVGLAGRGKSLPSRMSGGQQQRVAIARALIGAPTLLLADEPTGNLDSRTGSEVLELLHGLRRERGMTILLATHDTAIASDCDRVLHMRDGQIVSEREPIA